MSPKLSVVIITRNQPNELKSIIDAASANAVSESKDDVEIIVVDDHSDDVAQFANMQTFSDFHARYGFGRYEYLTSRRLPGGARNRGLELATGEYIWICDGDDQIEWSTIPQILTELNSRSRLPMLLLDYKTLNPTGAIDSISFAGAKLKPWQCGVMAWHKIIRSDLYGRFRDGVYSEDVDWWMRMCLESEIDHYHAPGIYGYTYRRLAPGSITATGADRTVGRNVRVINELKDIIDAAKKLKRPTSFLDHLTWLLDMYESGRV